MTLRTIVRWMSIILVTLAAVACGRADSQTAATATPDLPATVAASLAATQTAQAPTPTTAAASAPASAAADETPTCSVIVPTLRLRSGPSAQFAVVSLLSQGDTLVVIGSNPEGDWFLAESDVTDEAAWFNATAQFVECRGEVTVVAANLLPPTPTATPTNVPTTAAQATATSTPTPTPVALVVVPRTGGGDGDLFGDVKTDPAILAGSPNSPVFTDYLSLQIEVWLDDPSLPDVDGAGIDFVEISVVDPTGNTVYQQEESKPAYCMFGGDGPCNLLRLRPGATWPGGNDPIFNGEHTVQFRAIPKDDSKSEGNWNVEFQIQMPGGYSATQPIIVELEQIGRDSLDTSVSSTLVFQVSAYDSGRGSNDGDGIDNVDMRIFGPDGAQVYQRTEGNAGYCAFTGGEPNCNVLDLANSTRWSEGGALIQAGPHTLQATVTADDGRQETLTQQIDIVRSPSSPPAASEIVVELAQSGPGSTSSYVSDALVFQVIAYDPAVGNSDGDGIDRVVMSIFDSNGNEVYRQTENNAGYCAFGGGEPECNQLSLESGASWPQNGQTITDGAYTLQAVVDADSGAETIFTGVIQIDVP